MSKKIYQRYEIGQEMEDKGSVEVDLRKYRPKPQGKTKMFLRQGHDMIGGEIHGQTLPGKKGTVHRHISGEVPRGLTAVEEAIWNLEQKENK
jgi:hypothetical protein